MNTQADIVITGVGLVTNLGSTPLATWNAILAGTRSLGPMSELEQRPVPDKGGGQAVDLPEDFRPTWPRECRYLCFAAQHALAQANVFVTPPRRRGAVFGTTLHGMRAGGRFVRTGDVRHLVNLQAGAVLDRALSNLDIRGPRITTCSACSSGLASVAMGALLLRAGEVDTILAGGYDPVSEYSYGGFESLRLIASAAPMPFARDRDGMKVAEGYGVLHLERADDARARGATILAHLGGIGESSDAFHLTQPHPQGLGAVAAIRSALADAGIEPRDVDMVCAHGTATPNNDASEYAALAAVFGELLPRLPVTALKSHLGHTLGGAGAVELIIAVLARLNGVIPPIAGEHALDPAFENLFALHSQPLKKVLRNSMNISLGFGGANTCIVLTDPKPLPAHSNPHRALPAALPNQVVITGVGVVLPGAFGNDAFVRMLTQEGFGDSPRPADFSEEQLGELFSARRTRRMSNYVKLMLAAATQACRSAGVEGNASFLESSSAILATTHGSSGFCQDYYTQLVRDGLSAGNPVLFAEGVPNVAAAQLSLLFGIRGGCQSIIGTRNSLVDAIHCAALRIQQGVCQRAFVGAAEERSQVANRCYGAALGDHETDFTSSDGAVCFILESAQSAAERSGRVLATYERGAWCGQVCSGENVIEGPVKGDTAPGSAVMNVVAQLGDMNAAVGSWGGLGHDPHALKYVKMRCPTWSSHQRFPELFSVGPGVGLAAAILGGISLDSPANKGRPLRLGVLSNEFCGGDCSGVLVKIHRSSPPSL